MSNSGPSKAQATNTAKLILDHRTETTPFAFVPIGEFTIKAGDSSFVDITNTGAYARIAIDGGRWVWLGE